DMAGAPEVQKLDKAGQVEMRLVAAGARRDMGQLDAAIVTLQSSELASQAVQPWTARLRYAYADALLAAERADEAREWFAKAVEADRDGSTDASDRLAEMDGVEFMDALDAQDESDADLDAGSDTPADETEADETEAEETVDDETETETEDVHTDLGPDNGDAGKAETDVDKD
ncbi:tetratricopeptide repeat protein, partial [Streptomyces sp. WAC05374]|uniref:tetratricopeptide repeat protein n=1 Tax=Streptomyces sp. WAC05374 TaxID=2487420 RepID=UPI000F883A41